MWGSQGAGSVCVRVCACVRGHSYPCVEVCHWVCVELRGTLFGDYVFGSELRPETGTWHVTVTPIKEAAGPLEAGGRVCICPHCRHPAHAGRLGSRGLCVVGTWGLWVTPAPRPRPAYHPREPAGAGQLRGAHSRLLDFPDSISCDNQCLVPGSPGGGASPLSPLLSPWMFPPLRSDCAPSYCDTSFSVAPLADTCSALTLSRCPPCPQSPVGEPSALFLCPALAAALGGGGPGRSSCTEAAVSRAGAPGPLVQCQLR